VIDEHGDRKWGTKTAHVGKQYLGNLGKVDNGVVSVSSLWADEAVYYPIDVEPYTPAHHFAKGKADPAFRTKLQLAVELARRAKAAGLPFRAVVADAFYGKESTVQQGLEELGVGYVLALPSSHGWWHREGQIGGLQEAARTGGWEDADHPGRWIKLERCFRDGHGEPWWALEVAAGPYGPTKAQRVVVATTDPKTLPERTTWYVVTNLPRPGGERARESAHAPADLAEIVRLFGLRIWVEQSYKQVKYALGWGEYQVRGDRAIRRHWTLVWCAFSFCWLRQRDAAPSADPTQPVEPAPAALAAPTFPSGGKNQRPTGQFAAPAQRLVASSPARGPSMARTLDHALALLAGVVASAPALPTADAA